MTVVIDTSAVLAMLLGEPEATRFGKFLRDEKPAISAGSLIETLRVVLLRRGERARPEVYGLLSAFEVKVEPVDEMQVALAEDGHLRFGKGRGHALAVLNFGDLFAYALARRLDVPLLFKGNDFTQTDIRPALPT